MRGRPKTQIGECIVEDCKNNQFTHHYCFKHYERVKRFGRTERVNRTWENLTKNECQRHYRQRADSMNFYRFGGLREVIIQRDGEKCVDCGQTRQEHKEEFGRDITVNHIDKQGRYSDKPNNDPNNLETLCLRCHGSKDAIVHGRYAKYALRGA